MRQGHVCVCVCGGGATMSHGVVCVWGVGGNYESRSGGVKL